MTHFTFRRFLWSRSLYAIGGKWRSLGQLASARSVVPVARQLDMPPGARYNSSRDPAQQHSEPVA